MFNSEKERDRFLKIVSKLYLNCADDPIKSTRQNKLLNTIIYILSEKYSLDKSNLSFNLTKNLSDIIINEYQSLKDKYTTANFEFKRNKTKILIVIEQREGTKPKKIVKSVEAILLHVDKFQSNKKSYQKLSSKIQKAFTKFLTKKAAI